VSYPFDYLKKSQWQLRGATIFVVACFALATIIGSGGDDNSAGDPTFGANNTVDLSGTLDASGTGFSGVAIKAFLVTAPTMDSEQASATSNTSGQYSITVLRNTDTYLELSSAGYATQNSRFGSFDQDAGGLDFGMIPENDAEAVIDAAFGGMALNLADKAWLAVNVEDANGNEVDGVSVTTVPARAGGGALKCDGSLTGSDITAAAPACNPERGGPMYLAYYDANTEVAISATGSSDAPIAPVRVGEITFVSIQMSSPTPGPGATTRLFQIVAEEGGSVTTNPDVLFCIGPNTCEVEVAVGTQITLTATPDTGSHFDDWDRCNVEVKSDRTGGICEQTISIYSSNSVRAEFDPGAP
jgi:hypothetical protein